MKCVSSECVMRAKTQVLLAQSSYYGSMQGQVAAVGSRLSKSVIEQPRKDDINYD
jgi:hypothetical protein